MSFKLSTIFFIILISLFIVGGWFILETKETKQFVQNREELIISESKSTAPLPSSIILNVPFTPQAPFAQWSDPVYQNACEEASLIMAIYWVRNEPLTLDKAKEEIFALSQYEKKNYGHFHDTSAVDTLDIFKAFYNYQKADLFYDIDIEDIKKELAQGNLVIVPVNGQKLNNPYYVPPGPLEHMLVIRGYDDILQEFIVNDPGTSRGEGYRYSYQVIENAMRDYPSGYHEPITETRTVMIVIRQIE